MPVKWKIYYWCCWYILLWSIGLAVLFLIRLYRLNIVMGGISQIAVIYFGVSILGLLKSGYSVLLIRRLTKGTHVAASAFIFVQLCTIVFLFFLAVMIYISIPAYSFFIKSDAWFIFFFEVLGAITVTVLTIFISILDFKLPATLQEPHDNIDIIGQEIWVEKRYNIMSVKWQLYYLCNLYLLIWPIVMVALLLWNIIDGTVVYPGGIYIICVMLLLLFFISKAAASVNFYTKFKEGHPCSRPARIFFLILFCINLAITVFMLCICILNIPKGLPTNVDYFIMLVYLSLAFTVACSVYACIFDLPLMKEITRVQYKKIGPYT